MNKLSVVVKNEFYRYFISPLAYVYLISFLVLNGSFAVYFGHFMTRGQADLLPMFIYQPWLYLLFLPGISMRLWAEEFRTKTILQIITMPVSVTALVWGKFLASWLFCAVALILTFPFWITVNILGQPDNTVILISYLGSFLLAGCMLAISQTMSALTKNQVIALVLSVIANLIFFLSGVEYVLGFFRGFMPFSIIDMIASFSFLTHFDTIIRGLIEARDIVFFASLIILFNFTTVLIVSFKTSGTTAWLKSNRRGYYILIFAFLLIGFCGVNLLANNLLRRIRFDFTDEKIFTLTDSTRKILKRLPEPVLAKLYYSPILGQRNPEVRLMFDQIRLMLQQYAALSDGKFSFRIYNPEPFSNIEDRALNAGLQPLPIIDSNTNAYFGLTLTDETDRRQVISFFPLERKELLEQDLTEAVYLLNHQKKNLGLITSLPMFEDIIENVVTSKWEIIRRLQKFYNVITIDNTSPDLGNIDVLLIAHPRELSPRLLKQIQDFSYKGGKILLFMDIAAEAPRIFSPATQELKPSDLGNLPEGWGIKFHDKLAVADLGNSSTIDATLDYKSNPNFTQDLIQFYITGNGFNRDFKTTSLLKKMMLTSASVFTPLPNAENYFIPLLEAGDNSQLMTADVVYNAIHPAEILRHFEKDANPKYIAARVISKNRQKPYDLIVVGDSDLLYDSFWTIHQTILENNYSVPILDNANFVFNALDTLLGDDTLTGLRGKSIRSRTFEDLENRRKQALREFKIKEKDIFDNIEKTKLGLQEIWNKKNFEERRTFTPDELAVIAGIRRTMDTQRQELFNIRKELNADIRKTAAWVKFTNIYALPLLILLGLLFMFYKTAFRHPQTVSPRLKVDRRFALIGGISLTLLLLGSLSARLDNYLSGAPDYEGKAVFSKLAGQINDIRAITLRNNEQTLHFTLQDGLWKLREAPGFLVYQERIRSFLSALLEASYYEKKSSDLSKLSLFGLTPPGTPGSKAVRIELSGDKGQLLTSFDVGDYDVDLGRGARGAYIKFDQQFQVWLVSLDLIDLSLNPGDWTYSTVWNLRFGRLASAQGDEDTDTLANLAKVMLNTRLDKAVNFSELIHPDKTLKIDFEGGNRVEISFYRVDGQPYLHYNFALSANSNANLTLFADYVKNIFYAITDKDLKKIDNALFDSRTD